MIDPLSSIDVALFRFVNGTLANPVTDVVMPFVTDLNTTLFGRVLLCGAWLLLLVRGGKSGRTAALLLIPLIVVTDQVSSSLIKKFVMRPRPCHLVDGVPVVDHVRLLVGCGGGFSFPSSHAVNNFAAATLLSFHFPKWWPALFGWATLVGLSRVFVGVHYPSDVFGGMLLGVITGWAFAAGWKRVVLRYPALGPAPRTSRHPESPGSGPAR